MHAEGGCEVQEDKAASGVQGDGSGRKELQGGVLQSADRGKEDWRGSQGLGEEKRGRGRGKLA